MKLEEMLSALGAIDQHDAFASFWPEARRALPPATHAAQHLSSGVVSEAWRAGGFYAPEPPEELFAMIRRIRETPALLALAAYAHWRIFEGPRQPSHGAWPPLQEYLGDDAGLFYLAVALGFIPAVQAYHRSLGLPPSVMQGTGLQVARYCDNHRRGRGRPGIYHNQFGWLANYMAPNLYFRIGRFEYRKSTFQHPARVFRRRADGATVALSAGGLAFTEEGGRCLAGQPEPPGSWISTSADTPEAFAGTPITPWGRALRKPVQLFRTAWDCVLDQGDPILDMHIPGGGGMTPEAAGSSLKEAYRFFNERFPDPPVKAVASASWMFSDQIEMCLPPETNLAQMLRRLYLLPNASRANDGLWFVFLQDGAFNAATARRDTSLQRAILDYLARTGSPWHTGAMFIMGTEIESPATDAYRRQWSCLNNAVLSVVPKAKIYNA